MSQSAALAKNLACLTKALRRPMFGHRHVSIGRHGVALIGTAVITSFGLALFTAVAIVVQVQLFGQEVRGQSLGHSLLGAELLIWLGSFVAILMSGGLFFTAGNLLLRLGKRNFGLAYPAMGLLAGSLLGRLAAPRGGSLSTTETIFFLSVGMVAGYLYWLIAVPKEDGSVSGARSSTDRFQLEMPCKKRLA